MTAIKVVVNGVTGRMGQVALGAVAGAMDMAPVGGVDIRPPQGGLLKLPDGSRTLPFSTDLAGLLDQVKPQVMIDFTNAEACAKSYPIAASRGVYVVVGTSGISDAHQQEMDRIARQHEVGVFIAPNFALGAVVLAHLSRIAAKYFDYVDIVEMHHETKIDSPSGTAIALAKAISEGKRFQRNVPQKETLPGSRGADLNGVTVHSVRQPGRMAHHQVIFGGAGQTLILQHDTINRDCYVPGILYAVREVVKLKGLVVGLDKLLGL
jgi:4-hydroxy-tetrahydrodipicolinate reductase